MEIEQKIEVLTNLAGVLRKKMGRANSLKKKYESDENYYTLRYNKVLSIISDMEKENEKV